MKRFAVSIFAAACTFLLLIILSFWGKSVYLEGVQKQAGHLMQFLNEYVVQSNRRGKYVKSEDMARQLATMADCRICFFSADGDLLADSDTSGAERPELYFPINRLKIKDKTLSSSISSRNNQYVMNAFYPVELSAKDSMVLCASFPLQGYEKFFMMQEVAVWAGSILLILSAIIYVLQKKSFKEKENTQPQTDPNLKTEIDQMKFYSNERISLLSTVLTNIESGIIFFSPDCSILLMNPKAQSLTGAKSSLFFPNRASQNTEFPPVLRSVRSMAQESMAANEGEKKDLQTEDGKTLSIRTTVVYSKYTPFPFYGIQVFITDVTKKRRMEKIRDEFVSNVSHELRTPLTLICGFTETLQNWKELDEEDCQRSLEIIQIESNRLKHMISQLLDLSHIESRVDTGQLVPIDPIEPIRSIGSSLEALAEKSNLTFRMKLLDEKVKIKGDKNSVVQIVANLCENAVKYTPAGGTVLLSVKAVAGSLLIQVQDNGIGIAESEIPHIFERFYRVEKSRNKKRGGSGLGLAITKGLVEELGGSISVKSQPQKGSTFSVQFPLLQKAALCEGKAGGPSETAK